MSAQQPVAYETIRDVCWARLAAAASDPTDPMRLFAVATVDEFGLPDTRILTLAEVMSERGAIWFHSDRRSRKIDQLRACPYVAAVSYDRRENIQLRVKGKIIVHRNDSVIDWHWARLDAARQYAYGITDRPGQPIIEVERHQRRHAKLYRADRQAGRENFLMLELMLDAIDWLQLSDAGDRRAIMRRAEGWRVVPLSP